MALSEEGVKLIVSQMLEEFKGTFGNEVQEKLSELKSTIQGSIERDLGAIPGRQRPLRQVEGEQRRRDAQIC